MTRDTPLTVAPRVVMLLSATLLVTAVGTGLVDAARVSVTSLGEVSSTPALAAVEAPACVTDDLTGTLFGQPRHPHSTVRDAVLRLINTSGRTCRVQGWVDIAMVTPPGDLVPVPTDKVDHARGNDSFMLPPRASAWSWVQWDLCDAGGKGCGVGVALQYVVDPASTGTVADLTAVPEADRAGITMKAMRVGPCNPPTPLDHAPSRATLPCTAAMPVCPDCANALFMGSAAGAITGDVGSGFGVWAMLMRKVRRRSG